MPGKILTIYHRTPKLGLVSAIVSLGVKIGGGAKYGPGFYATYSITSQMRSNRMINLYGKYIIKAQVDITNFLVLDNNRFKYPDIDTQLNSKGIIVKGREKLLINKKYAKSSDLAHVLINILRWHKKLARKFDGMIYTGRQDGNCVVVWKPDPKISGLKFIAHAYAPTKVKANEIKWKEVKPVKAAVPKNLTTSDQWLKQISSMKPLTFQVLIKKLEDKPKAPEVELISKALEGKTDLIIKLFKLPIKPITSRSTYQRYIVEEILLHNSFKSSFKIHLAILKALAPEFAKEIDTKVTKSYYGSWNDKQSKLHKSKYMLQQMYKFTKHFSPAKRVDAAKFLLSLINKSNLDKNYISRNISIACKKPQIGKYI